MMDVPLYLDGFFFKSCSQSPPPQPFLPPPSVSLSLLGNKTFSEWKKSQGDSVKGLKD